MSITAPATIPVIKSRPLIGNIPEMGSDRLNFLLRLSRESDGLCAFRFGPRSTVYFVSTPELAHMVLVEKAECFEKPVRMQRDFGPIIGNGLLTSASSFHRRQRKLVAPAFAHRRLASYGDVMSEYSEQIQAEWTQGATLDMLPEMVRLTLWIVGKALYDANVRGDTDGVSKAVSEAMDIFNARLVSPFSIPLGWPTPGNKRVRESIETLDHVVYRMISERRATGEDRGDLLSILLKVQDEDDGSFMTDQQVRDEAMTIFLAGHETTANALAWTFYLLAHHPEIYDKMMAEVALLEGRRPTAEDLPRLSYTLQVFKEAMRLYPPVYMIGRRAVAPVQLGKYQLKRGLVLMSPYAMHRRPDLYSSPESFIPERWTPEFEQSLPKQAYMPFGGGARICIGNHFALMEGQLVLATISQWVRFELIDRRPVEPVASVALRPRTPIKLRVRRLKS